MEQHVGNRECSRKRGEVYSTDRGQRQGVRWNTGKQRRGCHFLDLYSGRVRRIRVAAQLNDTLQRMVCVASVIFSGGEPPAKIWNVPFKSGFLGADFEKRYRKALDNNRRF